MSAADVRWLDPLEMRAWRSLLSAHARLLAGLDDDLESSSGMSVADYAVLVHLSEAEGGHMRMSELADALLLSPSGLTRRLDGLVSSGLVERMKCPTDRRGAYAVLTDAGRHRLAKVAPDHVEQVRRRFVDRLDRDQLQALADTLDVIAEAQADGRPLLQASSPA
ncbi:MAG TPA: MarR family transcriptional regulator [Acidimicrobiales bacterium]|nr:MarR family transcriptional regulator [Acidimicrobiales bacterium]